MEHLSWLWKASDVFSHVELILVSDVLLKGNIRNDFCLNENGVVLLVVHHCHLRSGFHLWNHKVKHSTARFHQIGGGATDDDREAVPTFGWRCVWTWWRHDQLRHILSLRRSFLTPPQLHAYSSRYIAAQTEKENTTDVSELCECDLLGFAPYQFVRGEKKNQQHTFTSCKSWRGKLEVGRPRVELAWLWPLQVLLLFLLFFRLCLRRSWSFLRCFLFEKKQSWLWGGQTTSGKYKGA